MNSVSARSSVRRQLREVAQHRVHPRPDDAAEDDELDAVAIQQDVRDVEGVGDHRQAPVPATSRANARAVVPLPIAIVEPSATWAAAARAIVRFASRSGVAAAGDGPARRQGRAAVRAHEAALAGEALEVATDRGRRHAEVDGEVGHARATVGAQVVDQASAALRLPHARILRVLAHNVNRPCADRAAAATDAQKLRMGTSSAYDAADGVSPRHGPRARRVLVARRHVHRPRAGPPPEPAQGAPAVGPRRR